MYFFARANLIPIAALQPMLRVIAALKPAIHRLTIIFLVILSVTCKVIAQEYGYRHYVVKDGLAGSTVYDIYQDQEGFIWLATETGVSRFDGARFKNFTVNDGLPDNTIIRIYGDSKGRIWLIPFKHAICYYYRGKIYNQQNDTNLQKLKLTDYVFGISEAGNKDLWLLDAEGLYRISSSNEVTLSRKSQRGKFIKISKGKTGNMLVEQNGALYRLDDEKSTPSGYIKKQLTGGADQMIIQEQLYCQLKSFETLQITAPLHNLEYEYDVPPVNTMQYINDTIICLNTTKGTILFNIVTRKREQQFLVNKNVSKFFIDAEGGLWFTTLNEGVYRLSSTAFTNFKAESSNGQKLGVNKLQKYNEVIVAALDMGYLQEIRDNKARLIAIDKTGKSPNRNAVSALTVTGNWLAIGNGSDIYLKKRSLLKKIPLPIGAIKDITCISDTSLFTASSNALYKISYNRHWGYSIVWSGRTTCLLRRNDSIYFGTLNGLYVMTPDQKIVPLGNYDSLLQSRISAIKEDSNGSIWIATGGEGIIEVKNNKVKRRLNEQNGLCSNLARSIEVDTGYIWVGTDRGLNKVDIRTDPVKVTKYEAADGLASDIINTILIDGDKVYVGTPDGITSFNKNQQISPALCNLRMQAVYIDGKQAADTNTYNLQYGENDIRFDYVAISFRAADDMQYAYRLNGADTAWKITRQTSLELISLPPGKYKFELKAINKFGVSSQLYIANLHVQAPYWQTTWFFLLCLLASAGITWGVLAWQSNYHKERETEKRRIEQELLELEQKALRAQMNPHFIFNCLNSVQGYILDKDTAGANKYLSRFAYLIRQTLDNSLQPLVTIADELKYINTYLELEQMRGRNKFTFTTMNDLHVEADELLIPGMILQPFIENAIHHGLQQKTEANGHIDIRFSRQGKGIYCTIEDNGIGRKRAIELKGKSAISYTSRGMQLVRERIQLLNKGLDTPITVEITDRENEAGYATGTTVLVCFPDIKADNRN